ncbi:MAG TPA: 3'-5' exonuclease [Holophagaceae bacterium]|nr:3'-5' exonuclease [Holophagaceae bacterium]
MTRYLVFDTETGGLDPQAHDLLSLGCVASEDGQILAELEILVKHEPYRVSAGGMKVNRIDLVKHHAAALAPGEALKAFDAFCAEHFGSAPITLLGHNIAFDQAFLGAFFRSQGRELEPRFNHRTVDTHALAAGLQDAGKLPKGLRLSSGALFDFFGIAPAPELRHTALGDAIATHHLYWKLVERAR